jgi:hypothetical protein
MIETVFISGVDLMRRVHTWHQAADPGCPLNRRYRGISGQHLLAASLVGF